MMADGAQEEQAYCTNEKKTAYVAKSIIIIYLARSTVIFTTG